MKLKCIIIDDEPLARKGIEEELKGIDFLEIVGIAENVIQANDLDPNPSPRFNFP